MKSEVILKGYAGNKLHGTWYYNKNVSRIPPIVLLHGIFTDSREFGVFPEILCAKGMSVLTFDFSGHGKSEGIISYIDRKIHMEDTLAASRFISGQQDSGIILLGHSFGAFAAALSAKEADTVKAAILLAPQIKSGGSLSPLKKIIFNTFGILYNILPFLPDIYIRNSVNYNKLFYNPQNALKAEEIGFASPMKNIKICRYAIGLNNQQIICHINKPLLFIACEKDEQIPVRNVRTLYESTTGEFNKFEVVEGAGHSPFIEAPNQLANIVYNFCESISLKYSDQNERIR
ncbi:alpha/beta hydrolase [Candidatus Magnetominusculus xianensis]|uniref:Alpha/beta hydrolase n=1 Tax=Candidatus Magnetominusculus xianensis TaxID=1748249 RepID=A0ABR5SGL5_9BACT|nr:alpha/beta hydrolase [Candidatus Magnetominusculus xianensis]KWT90141.1 alpha/beta hydrolase [Candidatus Magnetominusculus xianensis]MBF0403635.1 alpha/beta hydrolase [Nitrospirota bacterium]